MGFLLRVGGLIGGMVLLIMTVAGYILRQEPSEAYWMLATSYEPPYGLTLTTPDGGITRQLIETPHTPIEDHFHWCDQDGVVFHQAYDFYTQFSNLVAIRLDNNQRSTILENIFLRVMRPSPNREWVVFIGSEENGDDTLYLLECRTQTLKALMTVSFSHSQSLVFDYSWSPDSQWVVFSVNTTDGGLTYRATTDGVVLEPTYGAFYFPVWSPDNTEIIYTDMESGPYSVYRENVITSERMRLTTSLSNGVKAWLDNNWVILERWLQYPSRITVYRMRPDGSQASPLLDSQFAETYLAASDDGRWVYSSVNVRSGGHRETHLYRTDLTSMVSQRLISLESFDVGWLSVDGERLVFQGRFEGQDGLYSMAVDGTDLRFILPLDLPPSSWRAYFPPDAAWMYVMIWANTSQHYEYLSLLQVNIRTGQVDQFPSGEPLDFPSVIEGDFQAWKLSVLGSLLMLVALLLPPRLAVLWGRS